MNQNKISAARCLAAALAAANLLGTTAAAAGTVNLPAGYAAYSNEAFARLQEGVNLYAAKRAAASWGFHAATAGAAIDGDGNVRLSKKDSDHFAVINGTAGNKAFTFEADVEIDSGDPSAALIFGVSNPESPAEAWCGANINFADSNNAGLARVFGTGISSEPSENLQEFEKSGSWHLKLEMRDDGNFTYTFTDSNDKEGSVTGNVADWSGGSVGLLTYNSAATFSNITLDNTPVDLSDGISGTTMAQIDSTGETVVLSGSGDNIALYSGLTAAADNFIWEADVELINGNSAGLVFGAAGAEDINGWGAANVNGDKALVWGAGIDYNENDSADISSLNKSGTLHLKLEVDASGTFTYTVTDQDNKSVEKTGTFLSWKAGYLGLLSFDSTAAFSNITFTDKSATQDPGTDDEKLDVGGGNSSIKVPSGSGVTIDTENQTITVAKGDGDKAVIFEHDGELNNGFSFSADVKLGENGTSAALMFGATQQGASGSWYGANIDFAYGTKKCFRVFKGGGDTYAEKELPSTITADDQLRLDLKVDAAGKFIYTLYKKSENAAIMALFEAPTAPEGWVYVDQISGTISGWESETNKEVGLLTYNSGATFSNVSFDPTVPTVELPEKPAEGAKQVWNFKSRWEPDCTVDAENKTVSIAKGGDKFAILYDTDGSDIRTKSFTLEADVKLADGGRSAALVFGVENKNTPGSHWNAANVDFLNGNQDQIFRLFGPGLTDIGADAGGLTNNDELHLKIDVNENGGYTYTFGKKGENPRTITGTITGWAGGYVGLLTFESTATFSNIMFENRVPAVDAPPAEGTEVTVGENFHTNLNGFKSYGEGGWTADPNGLHSNAKDKGDSFLFTDTTGGNFVYRTTVKFNGNDGAAALIFRSDANNSAKNSYVVNLSADDRAARFWRWEDGSVNNLINQGAAFADPNAESAYELKVVAIDNWVSYYVNDKLIASSGDYTLPGMLDNHGQKTAVNTGYVGLLNWNGDMTFQDTYLTPIDNDFTPVLTDITVTSSGTVEKKTQFVPTEPITIQYVKNDAATVNLTATAKDPDAELKYYGADGKEYPNGKNIPVAVGRNDLTVTSTVTNSDGTKATLTYRVNVHRRLPDDVYYNEQFRDQYHYSVQDGWANDPNGLVYFKGKYHMFYQFYDDVAWGPMHWAHATSTDLLHWTEEPIAFYPDANGAMFSGCIVADPENTSGFFGGVPGGGLVALITMDGNGQRIKLAYSTDEGKTWKKVDDIAADWTDDPLSDAAFRDPKVFRWENKWFMVLAGGPLRIYSSDNLKEWKCEQPYGDLHTECPDLYPIRMADGTIKWVLSRGGRFYKVGDFRQEGGRWQFIPDTDYVGNDGSAETNGVMNFGKDSYAAMTYYLHDFGTAENPNIPVITELNWMNTWDYCNKVARCADPEQTFNGTFNLHLTLGLKKEGSKYLLTQTPLAAYETLRETAAVSETGTPVSGTQALDFNGTSYEIVATFKPATGTKKVGFNVRVGNGQKTAVIYDIEAGQMYIDRSQSGKIVTNNDNEKTDRFTAVNGQNNVTLNTDGTIDMHLYVDRASVELFAKDYTVAGANQIFPDMSSDGLEIVSEGGTSTVDLEIYPLKSIWNAPEETTYTITFDPAGGSAVDPVQTRTDGKLSSIPEPTRSGYLFKGWYLQDGTSVTEDTVFLADTKVIAHWEEVKAGSYVIQFNANGGHMVSDAQTDTNGKLSSIPVPTRSGYIFKGWYLPNDSLLDENTVFTEDTTVTARWEELREGCYVIHFDSDGGSTVPSAETGTDGRLSSLPTPTRSGYTFTGWYLPNGTRVTTDTVFTESVTVTAGWSSNSSGGNSSSGSRPGSSIKPAESTEKKDTDKPKEDDRDTTPDDSDRKPSASPSYRDVPATEWFASAVQYVTANGMMAGNNGSFAPNDRLTRGMMAQILYNIGGGTGGASAAFPDVAASDWFADAVGWAASKSFMGGYSNGRFGPNDPITREQLAAILYRYAQEKGYFSAQPADLSAFVDGASTSDWAVEAVRWAVGSGLLSGKSGGRLDPAGQATRAEVAQILMNFGQNIAR